jgi:anti-sigma factor RsiW
MTHEEIQLKMFALCDGPLTSQERALVEGHLSQCRDCREALAAWKKAAPVLFPSLTVAEADEDRFTASVMDRVRAQEARENSFASSLRWALPLLGTAALALWVLATLVPSYQVTPANATVENFLVGDSPEVLGSTWSNVPEAHPGFQTVSSLPSGR